MPSDEGEMFLNSTKKSKGKKVTIRVVIEGKVQKVGLRNWIKQKAVSLGICGWVRNKSSGSVEAFFYGAEEDVGEIIKLCYQGSSFAHVKRIKEFPQMEISNLPLEFIILPTI